MTLRLRLLLILLTVVGTMGVVSLITAHLNRRIQHEVEGMARMTKAPLAPESARGRALSCDGHWDAAGHFAVDDIERLPVTRRPKLRGAVQQVAAMTREITLFGVPVRLDADTEFADQRGTADPFATLRVGQRIEVSCSVDGSGVWTARKLSLSPAKSSDKIKGTITWAKQLNDGRTELTIHGLRMLAPAGARVSGPQGPLYRMENATQMTLAVQDTLTAAHELLAERYRERELRARGDTARADQQRAVVDAVEERLQDGYESFAETVAQGTAADASIDAEDERTQLAAWVAGLDAQRVAFAQELERFVAAAATTPEDAQTILRDELEPRLRRHVLPEVHAYHLRTEEDLSAELKGIATRAEAAASLGLATNGVGLALALGLGLLASRSITRPLRQLRDAAARIGRGELGTRVELPGRDEIGTLAATMNKMAAELAATTVSVGNLSSVLDSMAGALLLLDADRQITAVNPAAAKLLGYMPDELLGQPFARICQDATAIDHTASAERMFRRRDGSSVPVSFSAAELRQADRTSRGFVCLAQDLTTRKAQEDRLHQSIRDQELLLREVHHRVKNSLQVISSLLALQVRGVTDQAVLDLFQESQDRIQSLVFIHDQLYRTRQIGQVDLRAYLGLLAAHLAQAHRAQAGDPIELVVDIDAVTLDIDRAQACGLLVNELLTNAYKHAFSGRDGGKVNLACRRTEPDRLVLEVADNGHGFAFSADRAREDRIGLTLIETLVRQLQGQLRYTREPGAHFRIEFALCPPAEPA